MQGWRRQIGWVAVTLVLLLLAFRNGSSSGYGAVIGLVGGGTVLALATFPVIVIHEAGHALAASMLHWPIKQFAAGPFVIIPKPFRIRGRISFGGGIRGWVMATPAARYRDRDMIWFAAAGPLANTLFAGVAYAIAAVLGPNLQISGILTFLSILSLVMAVANLIPFRMSGFASDGHKILAALRASAQSRRDFLRYKASTRSVRRWPDN